MDSEPEIPPVVKSPTVPAGSTPKKRTMILVLKILCAAIVALVTYTVAVECSWDRKARDKKRAEVVALANATITQIAYDTNLYATASMERLRENDMRLKKAERELAQMNKDWNDACDKWAPLCAAVFIVGLVVALASHKRKGPVSSVPENRKA